MPHSWVDVDNDKYYQHVCSDLYTMHLCKAEQPVESWAKTFFNEKRIFKAVLSMYFERTKWRKTHRLHFPLFTHHDLNVLYCNGLKCNKKMQIITLKCHTNHHDAEKDFILKLQNIYEIDFYINCTNMMFYWLTLYQHSKISFITYKMRELNMKGLLYRIKKEL